MQPSFGEMIRFDLGHIFLDGVGEKPPTSYLSIYIILKLKLTAKAAENGWFQYDCFLLGQFRPIFRKTCVSFRECTSLSISNLFFEGMGFCFLRMDFKVWLLL